MLIRDIIDRAGREYTPYTAIRWIEKKEIKEINYSDLEADIRAVRKGIRAAGFEGEHIALIGTNSLEWMESYMAVVTGKTTAIPLDAGMPVEDLIDMIDRSDSAGLFLGEKCTAMLDPILKACSKTVFDGLNITPSVSLEVGVGVGVEFLKFELFLKTSLAITLTMGAYSEETDELLSPVEVKTGVSDGTDVEIVSGLSLGDVYCYRYADSISYVTE